MNSCISNCRHVADFQQEIHWLNKKRVHFFSFLTFIPSCGYKTPIFTAAHFQGCVQYPKCFHYWTVLHVKSPLRIVGVAVSLPLLCFAVADWTRRWRRSSTPISFCRCPPPCPPPSSTAWQSTAPPSCRTSTGTHSACGPEMNLRL